MEEVAPDGVGKPFKIPDVIGPVQSQFFSDLGHGLLIGPKTQHHPDGVSGAEVDEG